VFSYSYLPKIDLVTTSGYLPTEQDILHARFPTSGINEYSFNLERVSFRYVRFMAIELSAFLCWSVTECCVYLLCCACHCGLMEVLTSSFFMYVYKSII
jgi:hypothetical protein